MFTIPKLPDTYNKIIIALGVGLISASYYELKEIDSEISNQFNKINSQIIEYNLKQRKLEYSFETLRYEIIDILSGKGILPYVYKPSEKEKTVFKLDSSKFSLLSSKWLEYQNLKDTIQQHNIDESLIEEYKILIDKNHNWAEKMIFRFNVLILLGVYMIFYGLKRMRKEMINKNK